MTPNIAHGTYTAYARHKCRCDECRAYQNERVRQNRALRLERVVSGAALPHGIRSTYDAGCRCTKCKGARSAASRREQGAKR